MSRNFCRTWRHVMFLEQDRQKGNQIVGSHLLADGDGEDPFRWVFLSDVCKHCEEAGCLEACPTGSIVRTEVGSVLVQNDVCNGCGYCVVSCPFGVIDRRPSPLPDAGGAFKCTFCYDRQKSGLVPACAKVCPTESIVFGRLDELREQAWKEGVVAGKGVDVAGGPIPRKPGYYGQAVVKPPVWTWEVPLYFFFGGMAGMSAVIASGAAIFHHLDLARTAMWIASIAGSILSPTLLIMDLGRPHLFLNMLRVFKHRSAMSMGAWILSAFGACAVPGLITLELHAHQIFPGTLDQLLRLAAVIFIFGSAIFGTLLATYTGVLIGATAIPAWFLHRTLLPIHFGTAGLGSSAALLELLGHRIATLNVLGCYSARVETALLIWLSVDKHGVADRAIHQHGSGWLIRIGEIFNGPLALVLRFFSFIPFAALSFLIGALVSRFGWIAVGKVSGSDPESVFAAER